ncbi:MAG: YdcF family protein, partial [Clostridiales bacterium]|nr:YdcF family protein [Clostridiales bacterium]
MLLSEADIKKNGLTVEQTDKLLFGKTYERVEKSDFAILLGTAPEYAVKRAQIAAEYYRAGGTQRIIATGGAVSDKTVTESSIMRAKLIELGVPAACVIDEPRALDTIQNMTCSATEIAKHCNIFDVKTVAVISEPFHMRRALYLANMFLPKFVKVVGYTQGIEAQRSAW